VIFAAKDMVLTGHQADVVENLLNFLAKSLFFCFFVMVGQYLVNNFFLL
jgi:hypothetical protein